MKTAATSIFFAFVVTLTNFSQASPIAGANKPAATYATSLYTAHDGRLILSLEKEVGQTVSVRLSQANGTTLFSQQVTKRQTKTQVRFNVSELPDGTYIVEVSNGTKMTTHQVQLSTPQTTTPSRQVAFN